MLRSYFFFISFVYGVLLPVYCFPLELTLPEAIKLSLENNSELRINQLELDIRKSEITRKKAEYIPILNLDSSYTYEEDDPGISNKTIKHQKYLAGISQKIPLGGELSLSVNNGLFDYSAYQTEFMNFKLGPEFIPELFTDTRTIPSQQDIHSIEINLFYRHHLLKDGIIGPSFVPVKESRYNHEIQKNEVNRFRSNLVKLVETSFFQTALRLKEIELYQEAFENNKQLFFDLKSKQELGLISEIDIMLAQTKVSEAHKQILSTKASFEDSAQTLKTLLNIEEQITIISPSILKHDLQTLDDLLELTKKNKEISSLKTNLEKEMLLLAEASNKQLPQLDIYFNVNKKDQDDPFTKANELKETEYTAGIIIIYPFYPTDPKENYLQAKKRVEKAKVMFREAELRITNQTRMLYNKIQWVEKKIVIHEDQLRIFQKRLGLALDAFKEGLIDLQRIYTIQDDLISGEKEYLYYQYELQILYFWLQELAGQESIITSRYATSKCAFK